MVPAAGFAIDLLPGRGLQRRLALAHVARTSAPRADTVVAVARAVRLVRRLRPARRRRRRRLRVAAGVVAARLLRRAGRRARARRRIPASPTASRCASAPAPRCRCPARRSPARCSPAIPSGPRSPPCAGRPVTTAAGRGGRREPRARARSTGPRSAATTAGGTRSDVAIHHVCGARDYDECRSRLDALRATGRRARLRARRLRGAHGGRLRRRRRSWSAALGRDDRASSPRSGCPRCSCRCRARRATTRPRNARDARPRPAPRWWSATPSSTRPASTPSSTELLADPDRSSAMGDAARALGAARRRRALRRSRRGGRR